MSGLSPPANFERTFVSSGSGIAITFMVAPVAVANLSTSFFWASGTLAPYQTVRVTLVNDANPDDADGLGALVAASLGADEAVLAPGAVDAAGLGGRLLAHPLARSATAATSVAGLRARLNDDHMIVAPPRCTRIGDGGQDPLIGGTHPTSFDGPRCDPFDQTPLGDHKHDDQGGADEYDMREDELPTDLERLAADEVVEPDGQCLLTL